MTDDIILNIMEEGVHSGLDNTAIRRKVIDQRPQTTISLDYVEYVRRKTEKKDLRAKNRKFLAGS